MGYENERLFDETNEFPIGMFYQTSYMPNPHHHIEYEIFYLESGESIFGTDDFEIELQPGNVVFINQGTTHYLKQKNANSSFRYYSLSFDSSVLGHEGDPIRDTFENIRISQLVSIPQKILDDIKDTAQAEKNKIYGHEIMLKTILFEILSYIIQTKQYVGISGKHNVNKNHNINAIEISLKYIREHYREPITMDDLLTITSYSKSHFIRLFKKHTGMNLTDYINKYRIEKSCLDLLYSRKNITEIATANGFNTVQYFSKIFKTYMNCTPKKYQKEGKNIIIPSSVSSII